MTYGVSVRLWWRNGIKELLWYGDKDIHLLLRDGWSLAATLEEECKLKRHLKLYDTRCITAGNMNKNYRKRGEEKERIRGGEVIIYFFWEVKLHSR